jgi:hypothetical protein
MNGTSVFSLLGKLAIEGVDKALAFLIISFDKLPDEEHNCEEVRNNVRHVVMELAVLMEVERRIGKSKIF